jgi:hypothetical protein
MANELEKKSDFTVRLHFAAALFNDKGQWIERLLEMTADQAPSRRFA